MTPGARMQSEGGGPAQPECARLTFRIPVVRSLPETSCASLSAFHKPPDVSYRQPQDIGPVRYHNSSRAFSAYMGRSCKGSHVR